jgi:hypothetical protein
MARINGMDTKKMDTKKIDKQSHRYCIVIYSIPLLNAQFYLINRNTIF